MGDTRCKHCGERIVPSSGPSGSWWTHQPSAEYPEHTHADCWSNTIATPEEARRG